MVKIYKPIVKWQTKDYKLLENIMMKHGDSTDKPLDILKQYPEFAKYSLKQFRNKICHFQRKKKKGLLQSTDARDDDNEKLIVVPQESIIVPPTSIVAPQNTTATAFMPTAGNLSMTLLHMTHTWTNKDAQEFITIQINLPSGLNLQEIDSVVQVDIADDGMSVVVAIELPSVLTDINTIRGGWERTDTTLTDEMQHEMLNTIDSNILLLKEKRQRNFSSQSIKGECKIAFEKECERDVVDMCIHHEEKNGGLVLYVTTKVRVRSIKAIPRKLQITSIPSGIPLNGNHATSSSTSILTNGNSSQDSNPPNHCPLTNTPIGPVTVSAPPYNVPAYSYNNPPNQLWTNAPIGPFAANVPPYNYPAYSYYNTPYHHPWTNNPTESVAVAIPPCNVPACSFPSDSLAKKAAVVPLLNNTQKDVTTGTTTDANRNISDDDVTKTHITSIVTDVTSTQNSTQPNHLLLTNTSIEHFTAIIPPCNVPAASSTHADAATDCCAQDCSDPLIKKSEVVSILNYVQEDAPRDNLSTQHSTATKPRPLTTNAPIEAVTVSMPPSKFSATSRAQNPDASILTDPGSLVPQMNDYCVQQQPTSLPQAIQTPTQLIHHSITGNTHELSWKKVKIECSD